jgi:hypothetical protein
LRRWNEKFDFINVPAQSFLTATIFDRSGIVESRLSLTPWKSVRCVPCCQLTGGLGGYIGFSRPEACRNCASPKPIQQ